MIIPIKNYFFEIKKYFTSTFVKLQKECSDTLKFYLVITKNPEIFKWNSFIVTALLSSRGGLGRVWWF